VPPPETRRAAGPPAGRLPSAAAVAIGGAAGAATRFGAHRIWPTGGAAFPWTGLWINVLGCFLMGVFAVALKLRLPHPPKLLSPLLTTGFLGGFTSFSTFTDDTRRLFDRGAAEQGAVYLILTVVGALVAVTLGSVTAHAAFGPPGTAAAGHRPEGKR
jgi:fluoride exporter